MFQVQTHLHNLKLKWRLSLSETGWGSNEGKYDPLKGELRASDIHKVNSTSPCCGDPALMPHQPKEHWPVVSTIDDL